VLKFDRFRWVSLQIQNLCDPNRIKHEGDIRDELGRLPRTLKESYDVTYNEIVLKLGVASRTIAERTIKWLNCAQRPLKSRELVAAVSLGSSVAECLNASVLDLLDACCNMVVLDTELDVFRFAHLSVREYLEGRDDLELKEGHSWALEKCMNSYLLEAAISNLEKRVETLLDGFRPYVDTYWLIHCKESESKHHSEAPPRSLRKFLDLAPRARVGFAAWVARVDHEEHNLFHKIHLDEEAKSSIAESRSVRSFPASPYFLACRYGWPAYIQDLLLLRNLDLHQRNHDKKTGLDVAMDAGHFEVVQQLLHHFVTVEKSSCKLEPGFRLGPAAVHGHAEVIQLGVEYGLGTEDRDDHGLTPLLLAAKHGQSEVVQVLIDHDACIAARDFKRLTALHHAAQSGHSSIIRLLLEANADISIQDNNGRTALHLAVLRTWGAASIPHTWTKDTSPRPAEAVPTLSESLQDYCAIDITSDKTSSYDAESAKLLLDNGADTNALDKDLRTPLHCAASVGNTAVIVMLINHGADIDSSGIFGKTPLIEAAIKREIETAELLLQLGADTEKRELGGMTPLHHAARYHDLKLIERLLEYKADVNAKDMYGFTPLHWTIVGSNNAIVKCDVIRALVENGADRKAQNMFGATASQLAVENMETEGDLAELVVMMTLLETG
jgi:ankyrin repeat protein